MIWMLLSFDGVQALAQATGLQPAAHARNVSGLTPADVIAPALRDNRSLMGPACGVEGQALFLRGPGPDGM